VTVPLATPSKKHRPQPPIPPPLPPGRLVNVPGRGEVFVRDQPPGPTADPDAPPILLLHGWTASADINWFQAYSALSDLGRVIAVDHRSHGRGLYTEQPFELEDAADDAAALLDTLGIDRVIAVGYSMGGPISMLLARRHPEKVQGLVLCATALEWRASRRERVVWSVLRWLQVLFKLGPPRRALEHYLRDAIEACPEIDDVRGWLMGELRRGDPVGVHQAGLALGRYDARPFVASIAAPTAVIVTTKDRLVRPRKQRALAQAVHAVDVVDIAADHDVCLLQPREFRAALRRTIAAVAGRVERTTARQPA
jgi:pimeloyl-ACP methyl ester carboxylesterase